MHFKKEEDRKLVLENSKNLKDYRFMKNKVVISPFYTNRQQAIRNVQMATKKAAELALEQYPQLFNGGAYLRPVGFDKLALPNEKPKEAKSYSYWKNKLIDLGKEASSKPYAVSSQEYYHAFNQIIAAEKLI
ncbi:hypothetical protein Ddc_15056 [Ditylenchus destructor]|nr:hypothetical protein Ddc_15056 [Ditylenchus destructor]